MESFLHNYIIPNCGLGIVCDVVFPPTPFCDLPFPLALIQLIHTPPKKNRTITHTHLPKSPSPSQTNDDKTICVKLQRNSNKLQMDCLLKTFHTK